MEQARDDGVLDAPGALPATVLVALLNDARQGLLGLVDAIPDNVEVWQAVRAEPGDVVDLALLHLNASARRQPQYLGLGDNVRLSSIVSPATLAQVLGAVVPVLTTGELLVREGQHLELLVNGHRLDTWCDLRVSRFGDGVVLIWRDAAARAYHEAALRESEALFRGAFDDAPVGIALLDLEGRCLRVNSVLCEYLDASEPHLLGHGYEVLIHPAERDGWYARTRELTSGARDREAAEMRWITELGDTVWLDVSRALVTDSSDQPVCLLLHAQDVGPRKLAEQELARRQVLLERSNEELAQFAHIASHDLQEPVRKLQVMADLLERVAGDQLAADAHEHLARMRRSAARMSEMIDALRAYSAHTEPPAEHRPVSLERVVAEVLEDLERLSEERGAVIEVGPLPVVVGDAAALRELVQNLVANALKFSQPGHPPQITITASRRRQTVELRVTDEGIGFDMGYLDRIFQPFQQLHVRGEYPGTGIGLAVAQRIAREHGGELTALSEPGRGATFILRLPTLGAPAGGGED